jgi:hypothetical protein
VPTVGVYAEPATFALSERRESFSLMAGHADQVRSLVRFAIERKLGFDAGIAILHGDEERDLALAEDSARALRAAGARSVVLGVVPEVRDRRGMSGRQLCEQEVTTVLLARPDDPGAFEAMAAMTAGRAESIAILAPEAMGRRWLRMPPQTFSGTLFIAAPVPSWLDTDTPRILAAVTLLTEGLKKSGRELDRETFESAMEQISLSGYHDAVAIAFGPGRRTGIREVCMVRLEFACKPPPPSADPSQR